MLKAYVSLNKYKRVEFIIEKVLTGQLEVRSIQFCNATGKEGGYAVGAMRALPPAPAKPRLRAAVGGRKREENLQIFTPASSLLLLIPRR